MPPKPKSIFRQPGAKHFQLVHRSQRDPLYHDPEASKHVFKEVTRENDKKAYEAEIVHDSKARVGEASLYGVYYDDTEYDYMQHLKPVGVEEEGVESILIEAPQSAKKTRETKTKTGGITLRDLPEEVLPSTSELPRTYETQQAVPESISGFQPDMDPHLRQVLEALEDEAFVDDGMGDNFFQELVHEGERDGDDEVEFDFREEGIDDDEVAEDGVEEAEPATWEERFSQFKKSQAAAQAATSDDGDEFASEGGDTIGGLPAMSVIGGKKRRRKGTSDASGYSMSSSSMYRNDALQTLDERFDQVILKEYEDEDEVPSSDGEDDDEAPQLITSREDFTSIIDQFLNDYEILGRKMKPKLEGETGAEKLDTLRRAMGQDQRVRDATAGEEQVVENDVWAEEEEKDDKWDCETILTTYSNLENHPRIIRARDFKPTPKIQLNPKTGLPSISEDPTSKSSSVEKQKPRALHNDSDDSDLSDSDLPARQTIARSRDETAEEKKARKAAVKAQQAVRRAEKKSNKAAFGSELQAAKYRRLRDARNMEPALDSVPQQPKEHHPLNDIDPIWTTSRTSRQIYSLGEVEKDISRLLSLAASSISLLTLPQTDGPDDNLPQGEERSEQFVLEVSEYFERLDAIQIAIRSSLAHIRHSRIAPSAINAPPPGFLPPSLGVSLPADEANEETMNNNRGLQEGRAERDAWKGIFDALTRMKAALDTEAAQEQTQSQSGSQGQTQNYNEAATDMEL
ncbi:Protein ltv1 [Marasmius crinis-equi]|uniref:Mediator of RNA polymerase II transcription subunit 11 n=1 Tax=Marasmius crinis-equi TaxID=585013 RepID=A0ABR3FZG9_9AGAR